MFKFGNLEINSKVVLGPMAGITTASYREFMSKFGCGFVVSEMVSDMGLIYGNKETKEYITFDKLNTYTGVQLFGHDPKSIAEACKIAITSNDHIDFFDINMGCPVPKVTKTGAGSALMSNPKLCGEIIKELKRVTNKPISAKIRLGWDNSSINFIEVIKELEDAGVDLISIHARTRKELYSGNPHFDLLKDIKKTMKVPLVVSGNVFSLDDAIKIFKLTNADAVMVARGGIGNPFLLKQINTYFETGERLNDPSFEEQKEFCLELAKMFIKEKGEDRGLRMYRAIAPKFFSGFNNSKTLRTRLATEMVTYKSLENILKDYKNQ